MRAEGPKRHQARAGREERGRGFELITEAFKNEGLEIPAIQEEFGGVRIIIKREIFYGIQQGMRVDPKTGRLVKVGDTGDVTNDVTKKLTERQRLILEALPFGVTKNVTKKDDVITVALASRFKKDPRTIKRDMRVLQELGLIEHVGPANGGYWKRLK